MVETQDDTFDGALADLLSQAHKKLTRLARYIHMSVTAEEDRQRLFAKLESLVQQLKEEKEKQEAAEVAFRTILDKSCAARKGLEEDRPGTRRITGWWFFPCFSFIRGFNIAS